MPKLLYSISEISQHVVLASRASFGHLNPQKQPLRIPTFGGGGGGEQFLKMSFFNIKLKNFHFNRNSMTLYKDEYYGLFQLMLLHVELHSQREINSSSPPF